MSNLFLLHIKTPSIIDRNSVGDIFKVIIKYDSFHKFPYEEARKDIIDITIDVLKETCNVKDDNAYELLKFDFVTGIDDIEAFKHFIFYDDTIHHWRLINYITPKLDILNYLYEGNIVRVVVSGSNDSSIKSRSKIKYFMSRIYCRDNVEIMYSSFDNFKDIISAASDKSMYAFVIENSIDIAQLDELTKEISSYNNIKVYVLNQNHIYRVSNIVSGVKFDRLYT